MERKYIKVQDLEIRLDKRKNYKNISLKIIPPFGNIAVTSPEFVSDREIKEFVLKNIEEIRKIIEKQKSKYKFNVNEYKNGEVFVVFGNDYILKISEGKKDKATFEDDKIILLLKDINDEKSAKKQVDRLLRMKLKAKANYYLLKYSKLMNLTFNDFGIKKMKTKWGSCNITDKFIWLNYELIRYDEFCLEYVVVHELSHLVETGHTKRFYSVVEKYLPNWEQAEDFLDKQIIT